MWKQLSYMKSGLSRKAKCSHVRAYRDAEDTALRKLFAVNGKGHANILFSQVVHLATAGQHAIHKLDKVVSPLLLFLRAF
jgi:hypothetical protein